MRYATDKEVKELINNINKNGLDASRINNGGFTYTVKRNSYHPTEYKGNAAKFEGKQKISIGSQIYQVIPNEYDIALTEEQNKTFQKCINEEMKSERFKRDLKHYFNAISYEILIYSSEYLNFMSGNWYKYIQAEEKLPLNSTEERKEQAKNKSIAEAERIKKHMEEKGYDFKGYEVELKHEDIHYTKEEFKEICDYCTGQKGINGETHPTHQSRRIEKGTEIKKERLKIFKSLELKSTGRKMLINVHAYGFEFIETQPVIK